MTDYIDPDDRSDPGLSTRESAVQYAIDEWEPPSEAVVRAVASVTNTPVLGLDPLYGVVDPTHLDGLFGDGRGASEENVVAFDFNGCRVTVTEDAVRVEERGRDGD